MATSIIEVLKLLFLVASDCMIQVDGSQSPEPEFIVTTDEPYAITFDLEYSQLHFDDAYESWNAIDGMDFHSSIPLVSNVVVTGQEPLHLDDIDKDLYSQIPLTEELTLGYNITEGNCSVNDSCGLLYPRAPTFQQSALTRVIVLLLIAIFSLIGNIATLSSILRTGRQGTSTVYMLLVQLAIADLLVSIFCILADALWTLSVQWYGGNILCKAVKFMQLFALYLSTFLLVLIGFDRLCAVRFPMRRARAKHHVRTGIVCVWTLSAIFSLPQVSAFQPN